MMFSIAVYEDSVWTFKNSVKCFLYHFLKYVQYQLELHLISFQNSINLEEIKCCILCDIYNVLNYRIWSA